MEIGLPRKLRDGSDETDVAPGISRVTARCFPNALQQIGPNDMLEDETMSILKSQVEVT